MKHTCIVLLSATSLMAAASGGLAQPPAEVDAAPQRGTQMLQSRFERSSPDIGEQLPDVTGYRSDGTKLSLNSLRGKYTVLVFGCLT